MTAPPDSAPENRRLGLDPALARAVAESLHLGAAEDAVSRVLTLTPTDAARLIETLDAPARQARVEAARGRLAPEILSELDEDVREEVVDLLGPARTGRALGELDTDDAVEVIQGLDEDVQEEVLEAVPASTRLATASSSSMVRGCSAPVSLCTKNGMGTPHCRCRDSVQSGRLAIMPCRRALPHSG